MVPWLSEAESFGWVYQVSHQKRAELSVPCLCQVGNVTLQALFYDILPSTTAVFS